MSKRICVIFILIILAETAFTQTKKASDIERITKEWAEVNNTQNLVKLEQLYADRVIFYGTLKDAASCISDKASFF